MKAHVCDQEAVSCRVVRTVSVGPDSWQDSDEELALLCKALGHPARVRIVRFLLKQGEGTRVCGDICDEIPLAQSTVSQHLKTLKKAGLISGEVRGPWVCYSINKARLARCGELLRAL